MFDDPPFFTGALVAGHIHTRVKADSAESRSRRVERRAEFVEQDIRRLQGRIDAIALGCQAMWELLRENTQLTDADILKRVEEVDMRDGALDGKMARGVSECATCQRPVNARRNTCIYCGANMPQSTEVFDR